MTSFYDATPVFFFIYPQLSFVTLLVFNEKKNLFRYNYFCPCDIEHSFKMPAENLEEEGLPKNPDLELAQVRPY